MAKIYRVIRIKLNQLVAENVGMITDLPTKRSRGVVGRGRGGQRPPIFPTGGTCPHSHFFGLKFVQKLVHCCNWLLTETQCKIISVQQN